MFESDEYRKKRGEGAPLLSLVGENGSVRPSGNTGTSIPDRADAGVSAAERHQRARLARGSRKPNPLLEELAAAKPREDPAAEALERDIRDIHASVEDHTARLGDAQPQSTRKPSRMRQPEQRRTERPSVESREYGQSEIFQPFIDPAIVFSAIWRWRYAIAALTIGALALGVMVALWTPHRYTAYAQILVDPREVKLVGQDVAPDFLSNEAALAIVDSQLELVRSPAVLSKVVARVNLDQDPEFNGTLEGFGGIAESVRFFISLFTGGNGAEERGLETVNNLRDSLWAERAARTFVINVGVTTRNPEKSAVIANELTRAFIEEQKSLQSTSARNASTALTGRLQSLKDDVEDAEQKLEQFRAENGLIGPANRLITDDQVSAVTGQLAVAKSETIVAKARAEAAKSVDVGSILSGGLPQDLTSPVLVGLRTRHAAQKQQVATLENALGPRHPKLSDAKAALRSIEADIGAEIQRIVAGTQADLRRAVQNEQALASELAVLKAEMVGNNDAGIQLRELEREAASARSVYESFLLRARETGEIEQLATTNVKVISPAEAPLSPSSLSRKITVLLFGAAGFAIGLMLAFIAALREAFFTPKGADRAAGPLGQGPGGSRSPRRHAYRASEGAAEPLMAGRQPAAAPAAHMSSEASEPSSTSNPQSENPMYPHPQPYPYFAPQGPMAQPMAQQPVAPQIWPWASAPMHPSPPYPVYGYPAPAQAYAPQPPYGYGMPQAAAVPGYPFPPMQQPLYQTPPTQAQPPQPRQTESAPRDDEELNDLRQSVREIRDTVEALMRRRAGRGSRVA
jgi:uncharacterized protein involved in exopolysaccharide biosynthesis